MPDTPKGGGGNGGEGGSAVALTEFERISRVGCLLLGLFLFVLGLVLLYSVVVIWPAVHAASTQGGPATAKIEWLGLSYTPNPDAAQLILVILVSAIGSYVHAAVSFTDFVGNRRLARSWVWWYLLRVLVGTSLAVLFYFAIRGGFFAGTTNSTDINPYGIAALSGLVGLFSKQATDKLREIFDTAFRVAPGYGDDARSDSITNPTPTITSTDPVKLTVGDTAIALVGTGFVATSVVRVTPVAGPPVERSAVVKTPQRIEVTLKPADVATAGTVVFTVANPSPGGGESEGTRVEVQAAPK